MHGTDTRRRTDVAIPLVRFALAGLLAVIVVGGIGVALQVRAARHDAINDAKALARIAGNGIVQPNITPALLAGDPDAIARIDGLVRSKILSQDGIERVKVWTADGRIVYSDLHPLIGRRFKLPEDEREALETGGAAAELTSLSRAENRLDRLQGKLLEVYLPIRSSDGRELLFELYQRQSTVATDAKATVLAFAPALIGALLILQLLQLPLAYRMARTLHDNRQEREALLLRALAASDTERRRIASDLHDGVVQDLAGTSYALAAAADRVGGQAPDEVSDALRDGARQTRRSIRQLRSLLVDIYPPDLHRAGLAAALSDLVAPLESHGVQARVELPPGLRLEPGAEALMFRTAQEALRNVMAHSDAEHVDVSVILDAQRAGLTIADDGRGFSPDDADAAHAHGHLGLRVLRDMARDAGGHLDIDSAPGGGTRVWLEVPV
ncbi:MAG: two-component system, NarL family, sensor kinase [Solirubrobacteraceae bacterium]|jgi:signal transduction histidine kinase|nr:two-component system, NarL family, sensor kinase [Solirubrobacteraceae bacterium]